MALFYVAYDLDKPGQNYPNLWEELKSLGAKRIQDSVWALKYRGTASELRDALKQHIDEDDRLVVIQSRSSAWSKLMFNPNKV